MMRDILEFAVGAGFWRFLGCWILLMVVCSVPVKIVQAFVRPRNETRAAIADLLDVLVAQAQFGAREPIVRIQAALAEKWGKNSEKELSS